MIVASNVSQRKVINKIILEIRADVKRCGQLLILQNI